MRKAILRLLDRIEYAPVLTFTPFFRWCDLWIGIYIDLPGHAIYICPVPMLGVKISWRVEKV